MLKKVARLASVLIQYTLYNMLIVSILYFFDFILKELTQADYRSKKDNYFYSYF